MKTPRHKGIIVILDGLGDRPCTELDHQTPLQYANSPELDRLARENIAGLMDPVLPGVPVETHTGVSILFGVPVADAVRLTRGPIEAAGIGLSMKSGDLFMRGNLITVGRSADDSGIEILDRRAGRINRDVDALTHELRNVQITSTIEASLYPSTQHRCVLRLRGENLSDEISDTDPGGAESRLGILESHPLDLNNPYAVRTCDAINAFVKHAQEVLHDHPVNTRRVTNGLPPANGIVTRGCGTYYPVKNYLGVRKISAAVISGDTTILGLGRMFGFSTRNNDEFTALPDTNIRLKLETALEALEDHDMVYVHIKGTDIAAHDHDPLTKARIIEQFDRELAQIDTSSMVVCICADHSTDSLRGEHNGDPVPVIVSSPNGRTDLATAFDEVSCTAGSLVRINGQGLLLTALDAMGHVGNLKATEARSLEL